MTTLLQQRWRAEADTRSCLPSAASLDSRYELTDEGLALLAASGDEQALAEILRHHGPWLLRRIVSQLSPAVRCETPAEDILQAISHGLWRSLANFQARGDGSLRAWLSGIATHKIRDALRRHQRLRALDAERERHAQFVADTRSPQAPLERAASAETFRIVSAEIARLPEIQREASRLVLLQGLSNGEAGARLKISTDAARQRVNRACAILARRLQGRLRGPGG